MRHVVIMFILGLFRGPVPSLAKAIILPTIAGINGEL